MSTFANSLTGSNLDIIIKLLKKIGGKLRGSLDGEDFQSVSIKGSDFIKRVFICKGWVKDKAGPAVRFRVKLGQLSDGEIMYDPDLSGWQDTVEDDIDLDLDGAKLKLSLKFTDEAGASHTAEFHG